MPQKIKMEFLHSGFREILLGAPVEQLVMGEAEKVASNAGEGYNAHVIVGGFGGGRYIGFASTDSWDAMLDEAENHTLEGAFG